MTDRSIANIMIAYAADAVDLARERFKLELDFSEASVEQVEMIIGEYESGLPRGIVNRRFGRQPTQEQLWQLAKIWGAYLGEVIRRRWGGTWASNKGRYDGPDVSLSVLDCRIYPPTKVYRRLLNGIEENIWHYYQVLSYDLLRRQERATDLHANGSTPTAESMHPPSGDPSAPAGSRSHPG